MDKEEFTKCFCQRLCDKKLASAREWKKVISPLEDDRLW